MSDRQEGIVTMGRNGGSRRTASREESSKNAGRQHSEHAKSHLLTSFGRIHRLVDSKFSAFLHFSEICLAVISVVFVILGAVHLIGQIPRVNTLIGSGGLHEGLEGLLSDILLLVVGIELAIMLVRRTPESLIEVMFFVIARKMLIKTEAFYELLVGVLALAGLFAIRKYLIGHELSSGSDMDEDSEL